MISTETTKQIKEFLNKWIDEKIKEIKSGRSDLKSTDFRPDLELSKDGKNKPFTSAFLVEGILRINEFERTLTGGIGKSFEECGRLIATENFAVAENGYEVIGDVTKNAIKEIENMATHVERKGRPNSYLEWVEKIVSLSKGGEKEERKQISDLYLKDKDGNEIFFEIKSPKPNKGQCVEVVRRHLHIHAIRKAVPPKARTFFAFAFNPYGENKEDYKWAFTVKHLDVENHVLIGKEFWDLIGGPGTNEEIIRIYKEVGKEKGKYILEQLTT